MNKLSVSAILSAILTIGSLAGAFVAVEERYAHAGDVKQLRYQVQLESLENKLDRIQDRIWRQDDRGYKTPSDIDNKRRLEAERIKTEQQLRDVQQKIINEK